MKTIRGSLIITLVAGLMVVAAFVASTAGASSMAKYPPCTKAALSAGLKRGPNAQKHAKVEASFGCSGGWAYSEVLVGNKQNGFDAVAVYKAKNGVWVTVDRAKPCLKHEIPKKIYKGACTTS